MQDLGAMIRASAAEERWERVRSAIGAHSAEDELRMLRDRVRQLEQRLASGRP